MCPICRTLHTIPDGAKHFPQNSYILETLNSRDLCEEHGKSLIFYCSNDTCKTPVCVDCFLKNHRKHDVVEYVQHKKAELMYRKVDEAIEHIKMVKAHKLRVNKNLLEKIEGFETEEERVIRQTSADIKDYYAKMRIQIRGFVRREKKTMKEMQKTLQDLANKRDEFKTMEVGPSETQIDAADLMARKALETPSEIPYMSFRFTDHRDEPDDSDSDDEDSDDEDELYENYLVELCGNFEETTYTMTKLTFTRKDRTV